MSGGLPCSVARPLVQGKHLCRRRFGRRSQPGRQIKMTDLSNKKITVLTVLVAALIVAVITQSVVIFGLHRRVAGEAEKETPNPLGVVQKDDEQPGTSLLPPDPFDSDPFDWNTDDWDPFKEMHSMHDRINQMFGSAFNRFQRSDDFGGIFGDYAFSPDINIEDQGNHYLVTVDLPGAEDSRLDVQIDGQTLTICGTIAAESKQEDGGSMLRQERQSGQFRRVVTLPSPVKADKMETKHKKGVLHIEIPKDDG
jgi:HSP20 family protein